MQQKWRRLDGRVIHQPIETEMQQMLVTEKANGHSLKVCIGTDSQVKGKQIKFATVIVLVRKGKGGFMYIQNDLVEHKIAIKERMLDEVARSIDVAYKLCNVFTKYDVAMKIHVDINTNPNYKSNSALKDAMGYILGMGFVFKAKPLAFASSGCANKMVQ